MKYLLSTIFALSLLISSAQTYTPLLSPNSIWVVEYEEYMSFPPQKWQLTFKHEGDTIINNKTYSQYGKISFPYSSYAFLREDKNTQKVYRYDLSQVNNECVLYDFSAQPGDTLYLCEFVIIIDSVRTITLSNGDERKIIYHHGSVDGTYYIEGVGSDVGFLEISEPVGPPSIEMMCFKEGETNLFGNRCGEISSINEVNLTLKKLKVYPNPSKSKIQLSQKFNDNAHYIIRNSLGKEIQKGVYQNTPINIKNLKPNIYSIEILDEYNQSFQKTKFIVN